jgi:hypothetical protein
MYSGTSLYGYAFVLYGGKGYHHTMTEENILHLVPENRIHWMQTQVILSYLINQYSTFRPALLLMIFFPLP